MTKINIAILGFGYWGPNLARNFSKFNECNISYIFDKDQKKLDLAHSLYPKSTCCKDIRVILQDQNINAVVIALPVSQHYNYAKLILQSNKHLLIEKPCTDSETKRCELIDIAKKRKLLMMIDYTFLYTNAVQKIKELIDNKEIGDILFFDALRTNIGLIRNDINVMLDLAVHDISIIQYLFPKMPKSVIATGMSYINNKIEDMVYMTLKYNNKQIAHTSSSWLFPFKNKRLVIGGTKKTIVYDDMEPIEKIKVYDKGYNISYIHDGRKKIFVDYRMGDIFVPKLLQEEALFNVCKDFISSIVNKTIPLANTSFALKVSSILSACSKSLLNNGKEIKII